MRLPNGHHSIDGIVKSDADRVRAERIAETFGMQVVSLIEVRASRRSGWGSEADKMHRWEELVAEAAALGATLYTVASTPILAGQVTPEAASYLKRCLTASCHPGSIDWKSFTLPQVFLPWKRSAHFWPVRRLECTYVEIPWFRVW